MTHVSFSIGKKKYEHQVSTDYCAIVFRYMLLNKISNIKMTHSFVCFVRKLNLLYIIFPYHHMVKVFYVLTIMVRKHCRFCKFLDKEDRG